MTAGKSTPDSVLCSVYVFCVCVCVCVCVLCGEREREREREREKRNDIFSRPAVFWMRSSRK